MEVGMRKQSLGWLLLGTAFLVAGCAPPVKIVKPDAGSSTAPVEQFAVQFDKDFVPGSFAADFSGTTITPLFSPTPTPGSTSFASIVYPQYMDYNWINTVNGSGGQNEQLLRVSGKSSSNGSCCDSVKFSPPATKIFRGGGSAITYDTGLDVRERETIVATVFVDAVPKEALAVRVTGHPSVSLNEQPAGSDILLSIPSNDRRVDFRIRGIVVSGEFFKIRAIATGYSSAAAGGRVLQAQ
jgi:hypothetical protein